MEEPTAKCQGTSGAQGIPDVGILEDSLEIFTCHINGESHMDFFKHGRATLRDQITSHPGWETLEQILDSHLMARRHSRQVTAHPETTDSSGRKLTSVLTLTGYQFLNHWQQWLSHS